MVLLWNGINILNHSASTDNFCLNQLVMVPKWLFSTISSTFISWYSSLKRFPSFSLPLNNNVPTAACVSWIHDVTHIPPARVFSSLRWDDLCVTWILVVDFSTKLCKTSARERKGQGQSCQATASTSREYHNPSARPPCGPSVTTVTSNLPAFSRERAPSGTEVRFPRLLPPGVNLCPGHLQAGLYRARARSEPDSWWCWFAPAVPLRTQLRGARPRCDTTALTRRGGRQGRAGAAGGVRPRRRGRRWLKKTFSVALAEYLLSGWRWGEPSPRAGSGVLGLSVPTDTGARREAGLLEGSGGREQPNGARLAGPGRGRQKGPCSPGRLRWWGRSTRGPGGSASAEPWPSLRLVCLGTLFPGVRPEGKLVLGKLGPRTHNPLSAPSFLSGIVVQHQGSPSTHRQRRGCCTCNLNRRNEEQIRVFTDCGYWVKWYYLVNALPSPVCI